MLRYRLVFTIRKINYIIINRYTHKKRMIFIKSTIEKINLNKEFNEIIKDIKINETVLKMNNYRQHYNTSCYEHCLFVSYYTYFICKKLHLDFKSAARASMLHDLFLYDWRFKNNRKGFHAFTHPKTSLENSCNLFELNDIEKDIILNHMWPVTFYRFPKHKETYIITLTDKYSAILETFNGFKETQIYKKIFRYAYILLGICVFRYFI